MKAGQIFLTSDRQPVTGVRRQVVKTKNHGDTKGTENHGVAQSRPPSVFRLPSYHHTVIARSPALAGRRSNLLLHPADYPLHLLYLRLLLLDRTY